MNRDDIIKTAERFASELDDYSKDIGESPGEWHNNGAQIIRSLIALVPKEGMVVVPWGIENELQRYRWSNEKLVQVLLGIHNLLPPPDVTVPDGTTYRFNYPDSLKPQEILHALAVRIREIPDEVHKAMLKAAKEGK